MQTAPELQNVRRQSAGVLKPGAIVAPRSLGGTETVFVTEAPCGLLQSVGLQVPALAEQATAESRMHLGTLSGRERETMLLVTTALMNKQVAGHLGLRDGTVKMHRGQAVRKMGARSLLELARMAEILGLHADDRRAQSAVSAGVDHNGL